MKNIISYLKIFKNQQLYIVLKDDAKKIEEGKKLDLSKAQENFLFKVDLKTTLVRRGSYA